MFARAKQKEPEEMLKIFYELLNNVHFLFILAKH